MSGPVLWFGGKGHLAPWIVDNLPSGATYVEPYGGAGSVLFAKPVSPIEVWNDLHGDLTNLFRVLRSSDAERLRRDVALVLHSRPEYEHAVGVLNSGERDYSYARAFAFFVAMNQGFGGTYPTVGRWAKSRGQRLSGGMGNNTAQWWRKVGWIGQWHERLGRVQIENRDALDVIQDYDSENTVFYLDPPYPGEKRPRSLNAYRHDLTDDHHERLVDLLLQINGQVVLSGYATDIYAPLAEAGWGVIERQVHARGVGNRGGKARTEVLWRRVRPPSSGSLQW